MLASLCCSVDAAGNVYRPHIDGAWPGSGLDDEGRYVFDAYGDRWSRLTFLVYLNDDFEGGHTTYYTPSEKQVCWAYILWLDRLSCCAVGSASVS